MLNLGLQLLLTTWEFDILAPLPGHPYLVTFLHRVLCQGFSFSL